MSIVARNIGQLDAGLQSKVGVQANHVDGEGDFVNDALAGSMTAREQFQVLKTVVLPITVDVVDGLFGVQVPTEMLRHDEAVFEDSVFFACDARRDGDNDVSMSFDMPFEADACFECGVERVCGLRALVFAFASLAAEALLRVVFAVSAGALVLATRGFSAALFTIEELFVFSMLAAAKAGASATAVHRVFTVFFAVLIQKTRLPVEWFAAHLTLKLDRFYAARFAAVRSFIQFSASAGTAFCAAVVRTFDKICSALLADSCRHDSVSVVGRLSMAGVVL